MWDVEPGHGPTPAKDVYVGPPFRVNRRYAERFGDAWVILSAKYGFIFPDFVIPASYSVSFKRASTNPIPIPSLRQQVGEMGLAKFSIVIGLGGRDYVSAVREAFQGNAPRLVFPFEGLRQGLAMHEANEAIARGQPF